MSQTREDRIRREYKAHRRCSWVHENGVGRFWLGLARKWKLPVQEIKRICKGECGAEPTPRILHIVRSLGVGEPRCNRYRGHTGNDHCATGPDGNHFHWNTNTKREPVQA